MRRAATNELPGLLAAGLIDSFGLAFGWTVFTLLAVSRGGLQAAGTYNAAMLVGVMISAPVTGWLAARLSGRGLLVLTGVVEMVLRVTTLCALLSDWPPAIIVGCIVIMNVAAWAGYAGMRAEVAAAAPGAQAMTRYAMSIAAIEALGAGAAAALPLSPHGDLNGALLAAVVTAYGASLLPTFNCARKSGVSSSRTAEHRATTTRARPRVSCPDPVLVNRSTPGFASMAWVKAHLAPLLAGALIMLLASGPTRLAVALGAQLYGHVAVVAATGAFSIGCLLSSIAVDRVSKLQLPISLVWPGWGIGMLVGWIVAPYSIVGLLMAQFLAGLSLTAFEGVMDAGVAEQAGPGRVTGALAWSAAARALGSAAAVRVLPMVVAAPAIGRLSSYSCIVLVTGACLVWSVVRLSGLARRPRTGVLSDRGWPRSVPTAEP